MRLFESFKLDRATVRPRLIVGIRYQLQVIADFTMPLRMPGLNLADALAEDWQAINHLGQESLGQTLARGLFNLGAEGLLVPSSRVSNATNLVVFPDKIRSDSFHGVLNAREIKRWIR